MAEYSDYASTSIQAEKTEIKSILYELGRCMNSNADIILLESMAPNGAETVKNEELELVPRLPFHCKVPINQRVAPLKLKFEFFDA